jgi:hypothetical protein
MGMKRRGALKGLGAKTDIHWEKKGNVKNSPNFWAEMDTLFGEACQHCNT